MLELDHGRHITFLLLLDLLTLLWIRQKLSLRAEPFSAARPITVEGQTHSLSQALSLLHPPCTAEPSTSAQGQTEVQALITAASLETTRCRLKCSNRATRNEQRDEFIFFLSVIYLLENKQQTNNNTPCIY